MGHKANLRNLLAVSVVVLLLAASCTSSTPETDLSSTVTDSIAPATDDTTSSQSSDVDEAEEETIAAMCRTLDLLSSAGVPAGRASVSLAETDLKTVSSSELAAYGDTLVAAPRTACPEHTDFADEIAYWLGF